jgi:hypothetical protein
MARKSRPINLPAPYLKRIRLDSSQISDATGYPLPFLCKGFDLAFDHAVTIIVGENGTGKSDHFRLIREFCADPRTFIATMME